MNFEPIIWGSASSAVSPTMVLFSIYMILDILRSFIQSKDRG